MSTAATFSPAVCPIWFQNQWANCGSCFFTSSTLILHWAFSKCADLHFWAWTMQREPHVLVITLQRQYLSKGGPWWGQTSAWAAQDYMHPLRFCPNRAVQRTWKHQGVPPVDCQYFTLSTGVSGAVIPREGKKATLKVIDQPGTTGRLRCWRVQTENRHGYQLFPQNETPLWVYLSATFNFHRMKHFSGELLISSHPFWRCLILCSFVICRVITDNVSFNHLQWGTLVLANFGRLWAKE